ncbi:MAG: hypothetical protein ACLUNN_12900, partial [Alistipes finegoldii]
SLCATIRPAVSQVSTADIPACASPPLLALFFGCSGLPASAWQVFTGPVSSNSAKHASLQRTGFSAIRSNSVSGHLRLRRNTRFEAANASDR